MAHGAMVGSGKLGSPRRGIAVAQAPPRHPVAYRPTPSYCRDGIRKRSSPEETFQSDRDRLLLVPHRPPPPPSSSSPPLPREGAGTSILGRRGAQGHGERHPPAPAPAPAPRGSSMEISKVQEPGV